MSCVSEFETNYTRPVDINKLRFIHRHLEADQPRKIIELGCGAGDILMSLRKYEQTIGIDIDEYQVRTARSLGLDARKGNASTYVGPDAPYDAVILSEVIEHVLQPDLLLANASRNLRPNGLLLLTTPNGFGPWEFHETHLNMRKTLRRSNILRRLLGMRRLETGDGYEHCQWFTMRRLLRLTSAAGFALVEQQNSDFITGSWRDIALASKLPSWTVSGWYFAFRKINGDRPSVDVSHRVLGSAPMAER
jgi:SAM-dependent methyltransferase